MAFRQTGIDWEPMDDNGAGLVFLIHEFENHEQLLAWMENNYETWWNILFDKFQPTTDMRPSKPSWKKLNKFFYITCQTVVFDMLPLPVEKKDETRFPKKPGKG
ncbi:MAG: hypothetical protein HY063_09145 [Bacteroidetes bacterium]|nr:hypothetical protein [Bacteroidota bacterium]